MRACPSAEGAPPGDKAGGGAGSLSGPSPERVVGPRGETVSPAAHSARG